MGNMEEQNSRTGLEIAIIGMAGRFPGSRNIDEFWENLKNSVESVTFLREEDLIKEGLDAELVSNPYWIKVRAAMDDYEYFDPLFFGYTPKEAEIMAPHIRVFHECAWEAMEHSGYNPRNYKGLIGLYAGSSTSVHWEVGTEVTGKSSDVGSLATFQLSDKDYLGTRVAHNFNLKGPTFMIQCACSTSLVAVHQACQGLLNGECHMALAGGISIMISDLNGYYYIDGSIKSRDGHCRTFDARASGAVFGSGIGVVLLKPLEEAIADRDTIYAVIKGLAVNNDGADKAAFPAPSVEGQSRVIRTAHQVAEVDPETITYIEAHGTGTNIGDPIEIEALKRAFRTTKQHYCAIGSVKSNVGHLDAAAGITGLIKTVLCLKHRLIPPSLNFETTNPKIDFENSPFFVNRKLREWGSDKDVLRAGVSAFGVGGTNAHAVLEDAPPAALSSLSREWQLITVSARTRTSLEENTRNLAKYFQDNPDRNFADAAFTLKVGRQRLERKRMLVCRDAREAAALLSTPGSEVVKSFSAKEQIRPAIFMFSGQGSQYVNMGRELYRKERVFREEMDRCFEVLRPLMDYDIKEILYPGQESCPADAEKLNRTANAQPVIFTIEYALARLLMKWGIEPYAMIGHSIGEYVAAVLSGVFSLEDALELVAARGRLMQQMAPGAMLSVPLPVEQLLPQLEGQLELAAVNSSSMCVISGPQPDIETFARQLKEKGIDSTRLHTSHAFHTRMMEPMLEEFETVVKRIHLNKPTIPYLSNLTGTWISVEDAADPAYWAKHIRGTVRFEEGLKELLKEEHGVFIEVGPGKALATFVRQHAHKKNTQFIVNLVRHPKDDDMPDDKFLLSKIGELWLYDQPIGWAEFYADEKRSRIPLPTYSFDRQYFWVDGDPFTYMGAEKMKFQTFQLGKPAEAPAARVKERGVDDWFYQPSWKRSGLTSAQTGRLEKETTPWLVFVNDEVIGQQLVDRLKQQGKTVITVTRGSEFVKAGDSHFIIDPCSPGHYESLLIELQEMGEVSFPGIFAHLWNIPAQPPSSGAEPQGLEIESLENSRTVGFYSLVYLVQAVGKLSISSKIRLAVVTMNMQEVIGGDLLNPEQAVVLGPIRVIPREYPNIWCKSIDIGWMGAIPGRLGQRLMEELVVDTGGTTVAYRGDQRWVQFLEPLTMEKPESGESSVQRFQAGGVYLISGGLGGIGLYLARDLARRIKPKLILTGRSDFPEKSQWQQWLKDHDHDDEDPISQKIKKLQEIEALGAEVMAMSAESSSLEEMTAVVTRAEERWGPIRGVIHAAGMADGGLIQLRKREDLERIFLPKVQGALVLDRLMAGRNLDMFILFSSVIAVAPPMGQVAYSAANAFLDAFAHYRSASGAPTLSINWDGWQEIGMAVNAMKQMMKEKQPPLSSKKESSHPLFQYSVMDGSGQEIYVSLFSANRYWLVDEHRVLLGKASMPGTGFLEMVRASLANYMREGNAGLEIREVQFLKPLMLRENEERKARLVLRRKENNFEFTAMSKTGKEENQWESHVIGKVGIIQVQRVQHPLKEILARCRKKGIPDVQQIKQTFNNPELFGPRWRSCRWIKTGNREWLSYLELPGEFAGDIDQYQLHPALLDVAVGFAAFVPEVFQGNSYLPFAYKRLKVSRPLKQKLYSWARYAKNNDEPNPGEFLALDVTIMDEEGTELAAVEGYTFKKIEMEARPVPVAREKPENFVLLPSEMGNLDTLAFRLAVRHAPGPEELEFEVFTVGLNFKDVLFALGVLPIPPGQELRLGFECAGKVTAVGEGVKNFKIGDNVLGLCTPCFLEYVTRPIHSLAKLPQGISFEEAATLPMPYMTAYYSLVKKADLQKGERVLIHSAAGGVGLAAVKVAQWIGAEIFATAGTEKKREYLGSLGISHVMDSRSLDFADQVKEITNGEGVDVVLNSLAGDFIPKSLSILRPYGRFLELGVKDINNNYKLGLRPFMNSLSYYAIVMTTEVPGIFSIWAEVIDHIGKNHFPPLPYRLFPASQAHEAFKYMLLGEHIGKNVVTMKDKGKLVITPLPASERADQPTRTLKDEEIPLYMWDSFHGRASSPSSLPTAPSPPAAPVTSSRYNLAEGILPQQGVEAFYRVLSEYRPQVIVSTKDFGEGGEILAAPIKNVSSPESIPGKKSGGRLHQRPELLTEFVPPRDPTEKGLVDIIQTLLGAEAGVLDDFFELGGDSLKASNLVNKIKETFSVEVPVSEIFVKKNIHKIAQLIKEAK